MAADQKTNGKAAQEIGKQQVFRSPVAVGAWVVWLLFAVANWIDLAVQGRDHISLVAAGILVMVTGVAYVTAQRPRVIAGDDALTVMNPLRDHRIPWTHISRVDVSDLLRVHCRLPDRTAADGEAEPGAGKAGAGKKDKVISAWAVHYSRRRQYSAEAKARRDSMRAAGPRAHRTVGMSQFGIPQPRTTRPTSYGTPNQEVEAQKIVRLLNDRVAAAGIERASERDSDQGTILASHDDYTSHDGYKSTNDTVLLTSTWDWLAIAALAVPALILLVCCLV